MTHLYPKPYLVGFYLKPTTPCDHFPCIKAPVSLLLPHISRVLFPVSGLSSRDDGSHVAGEENEAGAMMQNNDARSSIISSSSSDGPRPGMPSRGQGR